MYLYICDLHQYPNLVVAFCSLFLLLQAQHTMKGKLMKSHNKLPVGLCTIALAVLSACGGGGGGSSSSSTDSQTSPGVAAPTITVAGSTDINPGVQNQVTVTVGDADTALTNVSLTAEVVSFTGLSSAPNVYITTPIGAAGATRYLQIETQNTTELGTVTVKLTSSDGANKTTQSVTLNVVTDPYALQRTMINPTYVSYDWAFYSSLNNITRYYTGLVNQDTKLDQAALAHANYLAANGGIGTNETAGLTGYSGNTAVDRATAVGYSGHGVQDVAVIVPSTVTDISTVGTVAATKLLNSVYRQMIAQNGSRDVGVAQVVANGKRYMVAVLGTKTVIQRQHNPADFQLYPDVGSTGVFYAMEQDTPDAMPENAGACAGTPVSVQARYDATLSVTSFTLAETATSAVVNTKLLQSANDTNKLVGKNAAILIPFAPLKLNTQYTASFAGKITTVDGTTMAYSQSWNFKTTAVNGLANYGCSPSL